MATKRKPTKKRVDLLLRNSEVQTYKACRQQWNWAYGMNLKSKRPRPALEIGSTIHTGMEHWYIPGKKRGVHPAKTVAAIYYEGLKSGAHKEIYVRPDDNDDVDGESGDRVEIVDLMVEMMNNYVERWGKDEELEVIAPEQTFQVDVYDEDTRLYLFTACGQIDAVVRNRRTKQIGYLEHKTGAGLTPFGAPEPLDEQSGMYWTYGPTWLKATGQIKESDEVDFIIFNRMRKGFRDKRPANSLGQHLNKDGTVSKKQPPPLFARSVVQRSEHDQWILDQRMRSVAKEMLMIQRGELDIYKSPNRHCGYCEFRDMCEVHETGSDWEAILHAGFVGWLPYEDHVGKPHV